MKVFLIVLVGLLSGCAQLMNGQTQPVLKSHIYKDAYFTTCGGAVENWGSCNDKAQSTCAKGYKILEKNADSTGVKREIHFECRK
jgi:hypothetical protein